MIESDKQLLLSASKGLVAMIWPFTVPDLCLSVYRRIGLKAITLIGWAILCYIGWVEIIRVCVLTRWVLGPWFCVRRRLWSFWGSWSSAGCFFVFFSQALTALFKFGGDASRSIAFLYLLRESLHHRPSIIKFVNNSYKRLSKPLHGMKSKWLLSEKLELRRGPPFNLQVFK